MTRRDPIRVLAVTGQGPLAPSFRVRVGFMAADLERLGIEVVPVAEFTEEQAERLAGGHAAERALTVLGARARLRRRVARVSGASVCMIQRNAAIWPTLGPEFEAARERRVVFDVDDALWLDGMAAGGHPLGRFKRGAHRAAVLARRADHTIAANAYLAEWLEHAGGRVTVVPSTVDTRLIGVRAHEDRGELVVGWIGSRSTASYLDRLVRPLETFARQRPDLRLRLLVVGGSAPAVAGVTVDERVWSEQGERAALGEIDVGVMPMPDNDWTRGKSAYKTLVYMSAGIPVLADDVGVARGVVGDGDAGAVVSGHDAWVNGLEWLADASVRAARGASGRARVEEHYSVERWAPVLASILRGEA